MNVSPLGQDSEWTFERIHARDLSTNMRRATRSCPRRWACGAECGEGGQRVVADVPRAASTLAEGGGSRARHGLPVGPLPPTLGNAQNCSMATVSGQSDLAVRALGILAARAGDTSLERLASVLGTTSDRLLAVVGPLTHAGWVERGAGPDTFRYMQPRPAPTLHEVVEVVEGSTPIDDCVLRPGVSCAAFQSAPVCVAHVEWLRELNASAIVALPLAALLHPTRSPDGHIPGVDLDSRLSAWSRPGPDAGQGRAGEFELPVPIEAVPEPLPTGPESDRLPTTLARPC